MRYYFKWIDISTRLISPFILMLTGNTIIICLLTKNEQKRKSMTSSSDKNAKKVKSVSIVLLTTSFSYMLLTIPYMLYITVGQQLAHYYKDLDEYTSVMQLWFMISACFLYLNNSINFFLYCISGSHFRKEFYFMLRCCINIRDWISGTGSELETSTPILLMNILSLTNTKLLHLYPR